MSPEEMEVKRKEEEAAMKTITGDYGSGRIAKSEMRYII